MLDTNAGAANSESLKNRWIGLQRDIKIVSVLIVCKKSQQASWGLIFIRWTADMATEQGNEAGHWSIFRC